MESYRAELDAIQLATSGMSLPLPEPSAGAAAYALERMRALEADPRKRENFARYQRAVASGFRGEVDYRPVKLDIENVSRCNFRCTMCQVSDWPQGRRAQDMAVEAFKHLINEEYGLVEIKLQGVGEPLMAAPAFFEMIRYARARHIWVRTTTNASLLHLRDNRRALIDAGVNELQISIDGADKETFEAIRRGAVFERVIANCREVNAYARERGVRITKMWTVVQRANRHQLTDLVDLAAALGFRDHVLSLMPIDWGLEAWGPAIAAMTHKLAEDAALALVERGARLGVKVSFWQAPAKYRADNPCPWPFERSFVGSDGRVAPCCMIGNPDTLELGAWDGERYAAFRAAHLAGTPPEVCKGCYDCWHDESKKP